ncbi:putative quinol monooxygenase [Brevibacillus choshinensis]|uniref:putative quinol monooxygenase n=2 Tax=Brevibacillus choshinensis TaxID=54911 RepID=UPI00399CED96
MLGFCRSRAIFLGPWSIHPVPSLRIGSGTCRSFSGGTFPIQQPPLTICSSSMVCRSSISMNMVLCLVIIRDTHKGIDDSTYVHYEVWKTNEELTRHAQSSHYQEYRESIADLLLSREVNRLQTIE